MFQKIWKDPVWSKVIATGIIALIAAIYVAAKGIITCDLYGRDHNYSTSFLMHEYGYEFEHRAMLLQREADVLASLKDIPRNAVVPFSVKVTFLLGDPSVNRLSSRMSGSIWELASRLAAGMLLLFVFHFAIRFLMRAEFVQKL